MIFMLINSQNNNKSYINSNIFLKKILLIMLIFFPMIKEKCFPNLSENKV